MEERNEKFSQQLGLIAMMCKRRGEKIFSNGTGEGDGVRGRGAPAEEMGSG